MAKAKDPERLLPKKQVDAAYRLLADAMPGRTRTAKGPKDQPGAFRSCVSCMLSAQSRDTNTAAASKALFALTDTPQGILDLPDEKVAEAIKPCGLYNMKTRNLKKMCAYLIDELDGIVPDDRMGLMSMPGIGRKCADIVMSFHFGEDVIAVDTHVHRAANRIGIARGKTEEKTAESLEKRSPDWAMADGHFWLIQFGKKVCTSRAPKCDTCFLNEICAWYTATGTPPKGKPGYGGVSAG
ncbi:MAG: endonuclease III [Pseudomonadota bacterium]